MVDIVEHIAYSTYMNTAIPKPGQRVECVAMVGDPCPIPSGSRGTVTRIEQWGAGPRHNNIHVAWDSGRTLALLTDIDQYKVLGNE
jgi:hypothetical protein